MDITGYFMNINRNILFDIVINQLNKFENQYPNLDFDFLCYLSEIIILNDPIKHARFIGTLDEYNDLPESKTLICSPIDCGLPIGNLTSQLFSNVYMNLFDQYVKRVLHCKHYGRYVDDFYILSTDKDFLIRIQNDICNFLKNTLKLEINHKKTVINDINYGIEFLGAFIKPYRTYISNKSYKRMKKKISSVSDKRLESYISRIGLLKQYNSFNKRLELFYVYFS